MELRKLFFMNFSGFMGLQSEFSESFLNYMRNKDQIAILDEHVFLTNFNPQKLQRKSLNDFNSLMQVYRKAAKILRRIPGVKAFSLCNSLALGTYHQNSDVDLFLILDQKTFFTTRILVILIFELLRLRPLVCLSFWISDANLDLTTIKLESDTYLETWLQELKFESSSQNLVNEFNKLNAQQIEIIKDFKFTRLPSVFESYLKKWQLSRAKQKATHLVDCSGIIIKDGFLKFHHNDIRPKFRRYYRLGYDEFLQGNHVKTYQQYLQAESK